MRVSTPLFFGSTDYEFKNFGLKLLQNGLKESGTWRIVIDNDNELPVDAEAEFIVEPKQ